MTTPSDRVIKLLTDAFPAHQILNAKEETGSCEGFKFRILIVSEAFNGKTTLASHRLVQGALTTIMPETHALTICAYSPEKWQRMSEEDRRNANCADLMIIAWATQSFQHWYFYSHSEQNSRTSSLNEPIDPMLEAQFDAATTRLPAILTRVDQKTILKFYGLYKQAVEGAADPNKGPRWYETVARKKFNSWLANARMTRADAMAEYVSMMAQLDASWDASSVSGKKTGGMWGKMPSTMGTIEPEMFEDVVIHEPTRLETEMEKQWFAAMRESRVDEMSSLLEQNSELLEAKDQHLAMTALLWATDLGCDTVVQFLLEKGADVNAVDGCLQTALHFAAQCHRPLLAELLLQHGADRRALDADGLTPFECCDDEELRQRLAVD